jgi:flavin-dependent dehydrogenase
MPVPRSSAPYDVIVAGASFAGLAAVRRLRGRVLLLDRSPIGHGVTSACAAPVRIVAMMGAMASVQQIHHELVIHSPRRRTTWPLREPFCTFDYRRFCLEAATAAGIGSTVAECAGGSGLRMDRGIEFRLASVLGREGPAVRTTAGAFEGRFLVDATGPRASLAGHGRPRYAAFGLESEVNVRVDPGLHFYFVPEIRDGYAWAFPCGAATRFGVLSYRGRTKLLPALKAFMARFGTRPEARHGGYLATGWTSGVIHDAFVAGDAGGYCLPLSGEGIRTAVLSGDRCGELLQQVLEGDRTISDAQEAYRAHVAADRRRYRGLLLANLLLLALPQRWLGPAAAMVARPRLLRRFLRSYMRIGLAAAK